MSARIPPLASTAAEPGAMAVLDAAKKRFGMTPMVYRVMANAPALLVGYAQMAEALETGTLSRRAREQIALAVARRNNCEYCRAAHRVGGRFAGLSSAEIASAEQGIAENPREAMALRLARALLDTVGDIDDVLLEEARDHGFGDGELLEIAGHVAINVLTNMINRFARTPNDFGGIGVRAATEMMVRLGRAD
jgi:uncharacterized peroxidase-related enzyme